MNNEAKYETLERLLALTQSPNPNERSVAMHKLQRRLQAYGITIDDIQPNIAQQPPHRILTNLSELGRDLLALFYNILELN